MRLSDEDISKFQALYRSEFGFDISREEACEKAHKLLRLMSLVYRPMTKEEREAITKHRLNTKALLENIL
jgi:hypothetical protein